MAAIQAGAVRLLDTPPPRLRLEADSDLSSVDLRSSGPVLWAPQMKRTTMREIGPGMIIPAGFASLSVTMFKFACEMASSAEAGPFRPQLAYPMAAVIHAAACLEAFPSEEIEKITTTWGAEWESTIESLDRLETTKKWIVFPKLLDNKTFDNGREPFQNFSGLFDLRDALMHYRPIATAEIYVPKKVEPLRNKFTFDPYQDQNWTSKVLTPSCAR